jgi:hypothetical protein
MGITHDTRLCDTNPPSGARKEWVPKRMHKWQASGGCQRGEVTGRDRISPTPLHPTTHAETQ